MAPQWKDFVDTGFAPIDVEHRELADLLVHFVQMIQRGTLDEIEHAMSAFFERATAHFAHEEQLMRDSGWSQFSGHKIAHDLFLTEYGQMTGELHQEQELTPRIQEWAVTRLVEWFAFHVRTNDMPLGEFLATHERRGTLGQDPRPQPMN